jgi:hypothetical protein
MTGNLGAGNWGAFYAAGAHMKLAGKCNSSHQFIAGMSEASGDSDATIGFDDGEREW